MSDFEVRGFEMTNWADVAELFLAPECCWGTLQTPYQGRDDIKKKLENPPANMHRLVAFDESGERVVGLLGLSRHSGRRTHAADLGMFVHPEFHRQGVGTSLMVAAIELADRWLDLHRVELEVFVDNVGAIKLYENFDFLVEGTLRDYAFRDGHYVDVLAMARLR